MILFTYYLNFIGILILYYTWIVEKNKKRSKVLYIIGLLCIFIASFIIVIKE